MAETAGALILSLEDPAWQVRVKAASALGKLRAVSAVPALGSALVHEVSNLRKEAASALGEIASSTALPYLERASGDPDPDVRKIVRWAIGVCSAAS